MKIIDIKSQFSFLLWILLFWLNETFASPTDELILAGGDTGDTAVDVNAASQNNNVKGYECGNTFFYESEVKKALLKGLQNVHEEPEIHRYLGPLYSDSDSSEYLLFTIKKKDRTLLFNKYKPCNGFIVFKNDKKKVIDVLVRTSNNAFTKCIKRNGLQTEISPMIFESTNGYQCGHEFFSDQMIQESLKIARTKIGGNTKHPAPYTGSLFPENHGYLIWPILSRRTLHISGNGDRAPYNLVLNKDGDLIDVVIRGLFQNFLRCSRTKKTTAPESDPYTKLFVPAPKSGFQCGKIFFSIDDLNRAAETAKMVQAKRNVNTRYPILYNGHLFSEPCWLWPILNNGIIYAKARAGPFRVVLSRNFKVISAIMIHKDDKITICESKMLKGKKNHDTSDYICNDIIITNENLVTAAGAGCDRIQHENSRNKKFYPARYEGPRFEKEGPYLTYPITLSGHTYDGISKRPGRYRVVMNYACEVVGALLVIRSNNSKRRFLKCNKIKDDQSIEVSIDDLNQPISENRHTY